MLSPVWGAAGANRYHARMAANEGVRARPFTSILAGTDGSERAAEAVRQAASLASSLGAALTIAYVIDTGRPHDGDVDAEAEKALDAAAGVARLDGAETLVLTGEPGKALVEHAESDGVQLIALGPDAGFLTGAMHVGGTASHVLREARCSVLVARRAGEEFPRKIACAVDGSESSVDTAVIAGTIAAAAGSELRLEHVIPVFRGHNAEWTLGPKEESPPELAPSVLAAAALGVTPIREMAMGRPERALVAAAGRDGVDLMVVGHRGVSGMRRVLLGSVSEHVAHHAPCSVLVVRTTDRDA